ncbi:hypothetical protein F441_11686 [Phytophthora nicotianae CJ01A1]|uniref:Uncharacterized protein n=5 Tax=Phytophthora nicotianae TaxID=4792 RepID=W2Q367_PHYN3|nr:hypothetical protein PPTG_23296 [Phytophthora nicotianae INRA-310]ETI43249.1 hypothetical protein F443_11751 [Phytophthora nicotianae P1569]ETK83317.1 hypothetical protein L915_11441 [Phytophthora nicotianae]ETO71902.1 hypothetical protein F444_11837 [Phytophthora nicotianae P1976]ETP13042.1 hypothetical protein F441_11686 [Phytophthora nicotianae CJ01A1]ETL36722.1 hypothetical protein L916_11347 [Phytophthora nicotianae]
MERKLKWKSNVGERVRARVAAANPHGYPKQGLAVVDPVASSAASRTLQLRHAAEQVLKIEMASVLFRFGEGDEKL